MQTHTGEKPVQCDVSFSTKIGPRISEEKIEKYEEEKSEDAEGNLGKEDQIDDEFFTIKEEIEDISGEEDDGNFYEIEEIELETVAEDVTKTEKEYEDY